MPFEDTELDFLKEQRDRASRKLDERRRELDDASQTRNRLKSMYDPQLDYLKGHIPDLKAQIEYYRQQSQDAYNSGDKSGARDWSEASKRYRAQLNEAYNDKNRMQDELKPAGERFRAALEAFREAQAEFNQARDAFNKRLAYLKEESAKKREKQQQEREAERQRREQQQSRGSTMYDRSLRRSQTPMGAQGQYNLRGNQKGHSTQYYSDNTRVSWDTDGQGDSKRHWTNQNVKKGRPGRHTPPPDAKQ